ncbi:MAG: hypothetical protein SGILL_006062, partial [Bacillariaceae sp.]
GPAQFVGGSETFYPASNVVIKGPGTLGRSAHHGIHGNGNSDVVITKVTFQDFEVAAVSLNNVDYLTIKDCEIKNNRQDVPILGSFSAARFIRQYVMKLAEMDYKMMLRGKEVKAADVLKDLMESIKNVYTDVVQKGFIDQSKHPEEFHLFDNPKRVVDGPCYGFLVHGKGPAVAGFADYISADDSELSRDIFIEKNTIENIACWNNEIPAAVEDNRPVNDVRGAILQFEKTFESGASKYLAINEDGTYKGNVVADAQIMVAKAVLDNVLTSTPELQLAPNSINQNIVDWAAGTDSSKTVYTPQYRCNGDSMHHVIKGITVIRVDDVIGYSVNDNTIKNVRNLSEKHFQNCFDYHTTSLENQGEQQLGNIRSISVAATGGYRFLEDVEENGTLRRIFNISSLFLDLLDGGDDNADSLTVEEWEQKLLEAEEAHIRAEAERKIAEKEENHAQATLAKAEAKALKSRNKANRRWQKLVAARDNADGDDEDTQQKKIDKAQRKFDRRDGIAKEKEAQVAPAREVYEQKVAALDEARAAEMAALDVLESAKTSLDQAKQQDDGADDALTDGSLLESSSQDSSDDRRVRRRVSRAKGHTNGAHQRSLRARRLPSKSLVDRARAARSEIKKNTIEDVFSTNGCKTIGVDLQGTSREVEIEGNDVQLALHSPGLDECTTGLRIRSSVPLNDLAQNDNNFADGIKKEGVAFGSQSAVVLPDGHPKCGWDLGSPPGCPFANRR